MTNHPIFRGDLNASLGQVWTPTHISNHMINLLLPFMDSETRILDPAAGPGTFAHSILASGAPFKSISNFEIDDRLNDLLEETLTDGRISLNKGNFLTHNHGNIRYDIAILNPPYIRHELIDSNEKLFLVKEMKSITSQNFTKRMNYFGYFLVWSANLIETNGIMCAIVYDSLKSTKYGTELSDYFEENGEYVHREKISTPFENTLIDAEIVIWRKGITKEVAPLEMEFQIPKTSTREADHFFCSIKDIASVRRGTSFLKREFFVREIESKEYEFSEIITKQSIKKGLIAEANAFAILKTESNLKNAETLDKLRLEFPTSKLMDIKSLPTKVTGPILFNYYLRDNVRHLLNPKSLAASDNFYCITPFDPESIITFWVISNSTQAIDALLRNSRTQGSGLRKLQLFEYLDSDFPDYRNFNKETISRIYEIGVSAVRDDWSYESLRATSTSLLLELGYGNEG